MIYGDGQPKPAGTWDYFGACAPTQTWHTTYAQKSFSLGIFQWIAKSRRGTKRGKVVQRVIGKVSEAEAVIGKALEIVEKRNAESVK